jgi:hypothetical protein
MAEEGCTALEAMPRYAVCATKSARSPPRSATAVVTCHGGGESCCGIYVDTLYWMIETVARHTDTTASASSPAPVPLAATGTSALSSASIRW